MIVDSLYLIKKTCLCNCGILLEIRLCNPRDFSYGLAELFLMGKVDLNAFDLCDFLDFSLSLCCRWTIVGVSCEALLNEGNELKRVRVIIRDEVLFING